MGLIEIWPYQPHCYRMRFMKSFFKVLYYLLYIKSFVLSFVNNYNHHLKDSI